MKKKILLVSAICLLFAASSFGQRHSGGGGMQRNQSPGMGQRGQGQGQGQQMQARDQIRVHATGQQQMQSRTCTQSMQRVRTRLRTMSRISTSQPLSKEQANEWREQLRNEIQVMNREQQNLVNGLNPEQKNAVQKQTQQMQMTQQDFEKLSDALDMELALESPDPAKVRDQSRQMEKSLTKLRNQQQQISTELGLEQ